MNDKKTTRRRLLAAAGGGAALLAGGAARAQQNTAGGKVLKIGVLGVMRGPAASWGLVNKTCAEVAAAMYNERGGVEIGGEKYRVELTVIDDQLDPALALAGARQMLADGIRYIIGPNVDTTAAVIVPLLRAANAVNIAYGFARYLYAPPQRNSILGMVASYQDGPIIYDYLRQNNGVRSVSFVARNEADSLNQRDEGVKNAYGAGLTVLSSSVVYPHGTTDFRPFMARMLRGYDVGVMAGVTGQVQVRLGATPQPVGVKPDLVVLSGVAPGDAPLALVALRELGHQGLVGTETGQDARALATAGAAAEGFLSVGGASPPDGRSPYMADFVRRYTAQAGEWNDEAGTKVYALEMILRTLQQAGAAAIEDGTAFLAAVPNVAIDNPFLKEKKTLRYVGLKSFNQPRQIGVPLVVNEFRDGGFKPLFAGTVD